MAWIVVVVIQIAGIVAHFGIDQLPYLVVALHLWAAAGAYFLHSRKSRAVAIAQLAYIALVTWTALFPFIPDGASLEKILTLLQSIFMIWLAWRGIRAAWVCHRAANLRVQWKHVAAVGTLMALAIPGIFAGTVVVFRFFYTGVDYLTADHVVRGSVASFPIIMGMLTWKFPFVRRDMAKDVATVFE